jgi:fatty acid synthase subunit alpha
MGSERFENPGLQQYFFSLADLGAHRLIFMSIGSDMHELKSSITRSLCDQIFTWPIYWPKATNFSEAATHAIDLGPGGMSGIGPLTARNFDGHGVRIIITGDKGKGDAELFYSLDIKYEPCWSKKWAPGLVRTR